MIKRIRARRSLSFTRYVISKQESNSINDFYHQCFTAATTTSLDLIHAKLSLKTHWWTKTPEVGQKERGPIPSTAQSPQECFCTRDG